MRARRRGTHRTGRRAQDARGNRSKRRDHVRTDEENVLQGRRRARRSGHAGRMRPAGDQGDRRRGRCRRGWRGRRRRGQARLVQDVRARPHALLHPVHRARRPLDERRGQPRGRQQLRPWLAHAVRQGQRRHAHGVLAHAPAVPHEAHRREGRGQVRADHVGRGARHHRRQAQGAEGAVRSRVLRGAQPAVLRRARQPRAPLPQRARLAELPALRHLQLAAHVLAPRDHRRPRAREGH